MTMNEHQIVTTYKSEGGTVTVQTDEFECDHSANVEREIEAGVVDAEFTVAWLISQMRGIGMGIRKVSGETGDAEITIKTNNATTPDDTFVLTPENGLGWSLNSLFANPITADVTKLFISNSGTAKAQLFIRVGLDATPALPG